MIIIYIRSEKSKSDILTTCNYVGDVGTALYFLSCVGLFVAALIEVQAPVLSIMNGLGVMQLFICQYFNL